jgi:predicted Zn-dependent peptidase
MVYGGYFGSRLMQNLREEKGYTYGISSYIREEKEAILLLISANVGVEYTRKSIDEIKKELDFIIENEIPEEELELAKRQMLGDILALFDGPFAQIEAFQYLHGLSKTYEYYQNFILAIKNTSSKELKAIGKKYLSSANLRIAVAGKIE